MDQFEMTCIILSGIVLVMVLILIFTREKRD